MNQTAGLLAGLVGPCPECGNGRLQAAFDGELTNFVCRRCGTCWHPELHWVHRVDPATCPGCPSRAVCLAAGRPYGTRFRDSEEGAGRRSEWG